MCKLYVIYKYIIYIQLLYITVSDEIFTYRVLYVSY